MSERSVSLVCMPWHFVGSPSIQLGTLHALLEQSGIQCRSHSLYLELARFLADFAAEAGGFDLEDYGEVASRWMNVGAGEWLFATEEIRKRSLSRDERFFELCRASGMSSDLLAKLERTRALVPRFLDRCADEILAGAPAVVGFTCVYSQTIPSVALARVLKSRAPDLRIVFGGASCEGPMGPSLLSAFDVIDVVARGEVELVLHELMASVVEGSSTPRLPGLCFRDAVGDGVAGGNRRIVEIAPDESTRVAMDDVPVPVFDEYFERLERLGLARGILPQIPFETARGCWWGMKSHCTFCGLNGLSMAFRSKSPQRVVDEVSTLAVRHGVLDFTCTDNILDRKYFDTLLPELAQRGDDFSFFFETKSNLTEDHVRALRAAGIRAIQPGIESLSTPILKLMKKGVSAIQNVRLLKWCARYDVRVIWNLLYGFPGEAVEEYERMADAIPALVHLQPPTLSALMVYRFSPYHVRPSEHGIEIGAPLPYYRLLYDVGDERLRDLAQAFEYAHSDGRDPETYIGRVRAGVEQWSRDRERNRGALTYRRGPGFLVILDSRTTSPSPARYTLGEEEAELYLACDAGATFDSIAERLRSRTDAAMDESRMRGLLREFVDARLVYEENDRYLSLALPTSDARSIAPSRAAPRFTFERAQRAV